jgi:hypothetical protein
MSPTSFSPALASPQQQRANFSKSPTPTQTPPSISSLPPSSMMPSISSLPSSSMMPSSTPTFAQEEVKGWMERLGGLGWKKQWCVLKDKTLSWSKSEVYK